MATVKPFRAVRATRDKVALVTTRSYELYGKKERNSVLEYNPYSFLHVLRPGFKFRKRMTGTDRFRMVHNRYEEFKENGILLQDLKPGFYLHQKEFQNTRFWGLIGLASLEDYEKGVIRKHERTLRKREELFGNYLEITGFNAEPVLLTYKDDPYLNSLFVKYSQTRPEYEFTTNKERTHSLWLIQDEEELQGISETFESLPTLYIADGHHRTASSLFLKKKLEAENKPADDRTAYFMAYFIPESQLRITSFFRFVRTLGSLDKKEFLIRLDESYRIKNLGNHYYRPSRKHHFSMYLDGEYYQLYLRKSVYPIKDALDDLDPQILYSTVLRPILGIEDPTDDENLFHLPENDNEMQIKNLVDSGAYSVGFGCLPVSVEQMKSVADQGLIMPPKSTYIEPKLRSALTIYELKQ
jgi:uncharacterized protein (DUF1015 family)